MSPSPSLTSEAGRADLIIRAALAALAQQRATLDAGAFSEVMVTVRLHPSGDVRSTQLRLQQESRPEEHGAGHRYQG
jgi:hypothetical protein